MAGTAECYKWWDILGRASPNFKAGETLHSFSHGAALLLCTSPPLSNVRISLSLTNTVTPPRPPPPPINPPAGQCTFFEGERALSEALGWVIVVVRV
jgi:hypothetical protein